MEEIFWESRLFPWLVVFPSYSRELEEGKDMGQRRCSEANRPEFMTRCFVTSFMSLGYNFILFFICTKRYCQGQMTKLMYPSVSMEKVLINASV